MPTALGDVSTLEQYLREKLTACYSFIEHQKLLANKNPRSVTSLYYPAHFSALLSFFLMLKKCNAQIMQSIRNTSGNKAPTPQQQRKDSIIMSNRYRSVPKWIAFLSLQNWVLQNK